MVAGDKVIVDLAVKERLLAALRFEGFHISS